MVGLPLMVVAQACVPVWLARASGLVVNLSLVTEAAAMLAMGSVPVIFVAASEELVDNNAPSLSGNVSVRLVVPTGKIVR